MAKILFLLILCLTMISYYLLRDKLKKLKSRLSLTFLIIITLWVVITIVMYPRSSMNAALNGLNTWFNIVLPSLLPFFIISEILIGLGIVNFIGALLEPLMIRLFNVPGKGSVILAMSIISGYPVGAKLISKLRIQNSLTRIEAQRLISFCSTSGPLFMIGAVSVGMLKNPPIGFIIALSHYLGALLVGLFFRFYKKHDNIVKMKNKRNYFKYAFDELIKARENDGRPFGTLMSDAVKNSISTILLIGGFIIFYSVIIELLSLTNILEYLSQIILTVFPSLKETSLIKALISGIIEMTNGCRLVSLVESPNYILVVSSISFLIGWSGFSVHSQVITFLSKTDINIKLYIFSKALHGIFSAFISIILYKLMFNNQIIMRGVKKVTVQNTNFSISQFSIFKFSILIGIIIFVTLLLFSLIFGLLNNIKNSN